MFTEPITKRTYWDCRPPGSHHEAFSAALYRTRATVSLRMDLCDGAEAAADLRHALEIARRQKGPPLQLRAARDLAAVVG